MHQVYEHEPPATQISAAGMGDGQRITDGNGGVDRVAAAFQDIEPDFGREPLGADDHAMGALDRRQRSCDRWKTGRGQLEDHGENDAWAEPPQPPRAAYPHATALSRKALLFRPI